MFKIRAETISDGVAFGPVINFVKTTTVEERKNIPEKERGTEKRLLTDAIDAAANELRKTMKEVSMALGSDKAGIFECHLDILSDEEFQGDMYDLIGKEGYSAPYAAQVVSEKNALEMEELEDPSFAARAADFRDIGQRIISQLLRDSGDDAAFPPQPAVVAAVSLTPGETVRFCKQNLLGLIVCKGGRNSHAAILARSIGVPALVIQEDMLALLRNGTQVIMNMHPGELMVTPDEETLKAAENVRSREDGRKRHLSELLGKPAVTADGKQIKLYSNAGSIRDLPDITSAAPDGIGLFRTEVLFMEQDSLPNEETQAACYRQVLQAVKGKPVIFRLLDVGGDKPLPYMPHPAEKNPFLGWRGIRFLLDNPDILRTQIRGILIASAAAGETVRIMVPMVAEVREMTEVARIIGEEEKTTGGSAVPGMMVETPAAAMTVRAFAGVSRFISIGSNDLTQYTIAVDRESSQLSKLYSEFHPAVLALMKKAVTDAHAVGMETGICGEFASRPEGAALLAGIGFDELSMSCAAISRIKELIRSCSSEELQNLVFRVLDLPDSDAVRTEASAFVAEKGLS
jgi:phosphoenolpyruvate-protein phosphotransferase (PTS system enzyme I)